jgi:threonine dehydrogenase-like Zn-dependent dehydrogenase
MDEHVPESGEALEPLRRVAGQDAPGSQARCDLPVLVGGLLELAGQEVIAGVASDNTCPNCRAGYQSSCLHRELVGGAQAGRLRVPLADGTLAPTPDIPSDGLIPSLLTLSDVLGTGWFAAEAAAVKPGKTVAVVGDGAVGLLGVLSARQMGAARIIAMSRHDVRQQLALEFGATDIVTERGGDGVARIKALTEGIGADSVLECVGTQESMLQAIRCIRPGGFVGYVTGTAPRRRLR